MKSIKSQFLCDLGKAYDAESRIAKALPEMIKPDTSDDLKRLILAHAKETARHVMLLEQIFEWFGQPVAQKLTIAAADGTTMEFDSTLAQDSDLMSALRMIEQGSPPANGSKREWEGSSYNCLHDWANLLGNAEGAHFLEQILEEERLVTRQAPSRRKCAPL